MDQDGNDERWVSKVHPLSRAAEPDDPYQLLAEPVQGDPLEMLCGLLQEFAWLGYSAEQLLALFHHPGYPLLCELRVHFGEAEIRRQIDELTGLWGQLRFRETIAEDPEEMIEVVQITPLTRDTSPTEGANEAN